MATTAAFMANAALTAAAPLETGVIINDSYTFEQYVARRVHFLGQHNDYKHSCDLFVIVRRDAGYIYLSEYETLSCQEVRRRELEVCFEILLPLPTTNNMATISNYTLYPKEEWNPNYEHLPGGPIRSPSATPRRAGTGIMEHLQQEPMAPSVQVNMTATPTPGQMSSFKQGHGNQMLGPSPKTTIRTYDPNVMASVLAGLDNLPPLAPPPLFPLLPASHPPLATRQDDGNEKDAPLAEYEDEMAMPSGSAKDQLNRHGAKVTAVTSIVDESMVEERGHSIQANLPDPKMHIDQSTKGPRNLPLNQPSGAQSPVPPASKRKAASKKSTARSICPNRVTKPVASISKRRGRSALSVTIPSPPGQSASPDFSPLGTSNPLSPIIKGTALPKTKQQAIAAQHLVITRLTASNKKAKSFRPEFHIVPSISSGTTRSSRRKRATKKASKANEDETVFIACVCGSSKEPKRGDWIACDECTVWQHDACMGDGVPADKKGGKYLCQVCDPWAHRVLIQGLRGGKKQRG